MKRQTNIKVGDFVTIIRNGVHHQHEYKIGETYEVYHIKDHAWVYADATRDKTKYFLLSIEGHSSNPECELYISPFTSNCSFKIGDIVKIAQTSEYFLDDDPYNPTNILGTVTTIKPEDNSTGLVIMVKWDNNKTNSYQEIDLVYVSAPPSSPSVPENALSSFKEGDWIEFSSYSKTNDIDNIIQIHSINDTYCRGEPWIRLGMYKGTGSWDISRMFNIRKIDASDERIQQILPDNSPYLIITPLKTPSSPIIDYDGWKIGDELIDNDINEWFRAEGNNRWDNSWRKGAGFFSENRKIEKIDVKSGAMAFLVSGTLNIWMRADGYRNFISSCKPSSSNILPVKPTEHLEFQTPIIMKKPNKKRKLITINN